MEVFEELCAQNEKLLEFTMLPIFVCSVNWPALW